MKVKFQKNYAKLFMVVFAFMLFLCSTVLAGGRDDVEFDGSRRYVFMSHETVESLLPGYDHAMFGLGIVSMFTPKEINLLIAGIEISLYLSKKQMVKADHGDGIICEQTLAPTDSGGFRRTAWCTVRIHSQ